MTATGRRAAGPGITERVMLDLVHHRFRHVRPGTTDAYRYVVAEHVQFDPLGGNAPDCAPRRCLDVIVADMWRSDGYALHGVEIKTSRSDLVRELAAPEKAAAFAAHLDYFWVAVSHPGVLRGLDIPDTWGVLCVADTGDSGVRTSSGAAVAPLRAVRSGPRLRPLVDRGSLIDPVPRSVQSALLRATRKTYTRTTTGTSVQADRWVS